MQDAADRRSAVRHPRADKRLIDDGQRLAPIDVGVRERASWRREIPSAFVCPAFV